MKVFDSPLGNICLGSLNDGFKEAIDHLDASGIYLLADQHTATHCLPLVKEVLGNVPDIVLLPGEQNKTIDQCIAVWSALARLGADRSGLVINVGGGMICDLGGFAASCYLRGIRFVHLPTSLLAMADAAIGGKTGVDFEGYKNYIGHFATPELVWIDPVFLNTLPAPEWQDGWAEIVKHTIIGSPALWALLQEKMPPAHDLWSVLELNIPVKETITAQDPKEKGIRKVLNFGHTIGHALESSFLHTRHPLTHGQAVTLGMMAETKIALDKRMIGEEDFDRILGLIHRMLRPVEVTLPPWDIFSHWLSGDKKKAGGQPRFSLPTGIGVCQWDIPVTNDEIKSSLSWLETQLLRTADR